MNIKPFDFAAIGLAVGITAGSAAFIYTGSGSQSSIRIKAEKTEWMFPQDAAEIIHIPGPLGNTVVEMRDRQVRVRSSPCDNQTCVAAGIIQKQGQWIACLPNKVLVSIEGVEAIEEIKGIEDLDDVDAALW